MNNLTCKLFFSAVKFEFRSFQFYRLLQWVLFYIKVFVSCILDFLLHDVMQREVDNNKWPTAGFFTDFANFANFLPEEWMTIVMSKGANFYLKLITF